MVVMLSKKTAYPVIADAPSGLRRPAIPHLIEYADALTTGPLGLTQADLIIRLGNAPLSHTLQHYLSKQTCPILRIDNQIVQQDYLHRAFILLHRPNTNTLQQLIEQIQNGDPEWLLLWKNASENAVQNVKKYLQNAHWSEVKAASIICNHKGFDWLHLANSLSIRLGNLLCEPTPTSNMIFANRGVNGIDGTLGTFLGELYHTKKRGLLLIGDQAMIHDLPALASANKHSLHGCICILNNNGNALFDLLAVSRLPDYETIIRNPSAIQFSHLAAAFQLPYSRCENEDHLIHALDCKQHSSGIHIMEVCLPPEKTASSFHELYKMIVTSSALKHEIKQAIAEYQ